MLEQAPAHLLDEERGLAARDADLFWLPGAEVGSARQVSELAAAASDREHQRPGDGLVPLAERLEDCQAALHTGAVLGIPRAKDRGETGPGAVGEP
ncbi:MAG TPA: hypothetical protein VMW75_21545, partial [Thermoanaerobaculia bacterium]|nr:hypothetical protein [Thermoanaerobaculia bacterium]